MSRLPDLDDFLEDDEEFPGDDWDWGYAFGKSAEQERIISLIEKYGSEDFTFDLIALIRGEQEISDDAFWKSLKDEEQHPPQTFRDRSNGE